MLIKQQVTLVLVKKSDDKASVTVKKRGQMGAAWLTQKCAFLWKERP